MTPQEFNALPLEIQQTLKAGLLMQQLLSDADAAKVVGPAAEAALKKINPAISTIEERAAPIVAKLRQEFDAKLADRDKKTDEERATAELSAKIASAKAEDGFTDEGIANILKTMQDRGVADFDIAKKAYLHDNPPMPATPSTASSQMDWNVYENFSSGDAKSFFDGTGANSPSITDNPEKWERATALAYLNGHIALPTT